MCKVSSSISTKYTFDITELAHPAVTSKVTTYLCKTCHLSLNELKIPAQAVSNKMKIFPHSVTKYQNITQEHTIVFRRILFKKVTIVQKGHFPKLDGSICNTRPIEPSSLINTLQHGADSNGFVMVKLKRKLSFCGYVYFEQVCQESLYQEVLYLKESDQFYHDISILINNIPNELTNLTELDGNFSEAVNLLRRKSQPM